MSTAPSFGKVTKEKRWHARSKYKHDNGGVNLLIEFSGDERVGQSFSFHRCYNKRGGWICCAVRISNSSYAIGWWQIVLGINIWSQLTNCEHSHASNDHTFDIFSWASCCVSSTALVLWWLYNISLTHYKQNSIGLHWFWQKVCTCQQK